MKLLPLDVDQRNVEEQGPYMPDVVIAYDQYGTGLTAKLLVERINARIRGCRFDLHLWRLDVLTFPSCQIKAGEQAGKADIVIFAVQGEICWPETTKQWVRSWISEARQRTNALVALIAGNQQNNTDMKHSAAYLYLEEVANQGRMDFFPHACRTSDELIGDDLRHRATYITRFLQECLN